MAEVLYKQSDRAYQAKVRLLRREYITLYVGLYAALKMLLAGTYERYSRDGKLTYAEMRKYNRLERLEAEMRDEIRKFGGGASRLTDRSLRAMYEDLYFDTGKAIEAAAGIAIGYTLLRGLLVDEAIARPTTGASILNRILMHRDDLAWKVRQIVTRGLVRGATFQQMMAEVRKQLSVDAVRATRWVNTEAHRLQNEAKFAAGQEAVKKGVYIRKVWATTMDGRERDTHHEMNGQVRRADEEFVSPSGARAMYPGGFGILEEDANCRCEFYWITKAE